MQKADVIKKKCLFRLGVTEKRYMGYTDVKRERERGMATATAKTKQ